MTHPKSIAFLERRGTIKAGPGNVVDDIRRARRERGNPDPDDSAARLRPTPKR